MSQSDLRSNRFASMNATMRSRVVLVFGILTAALFSPTRASAQAQCDNLSPSCNQIVQDHCLLFGDCNLFSQPGGGIGGGNNLPPQNGGGGGDVPEPGAGLTPETVLETPNFSESGTQSRVQHTAMKVSFSCDTDGGATACYDSSARLPNPQTTSTPGRPPVENQVNTEPVADDAEFVVDNTDLIRPFYDVPFVFTRYYRSGIGTQTALGFGWSHSYDQHIIETRATVFGGPQGCKTDYPDVFYQDARLGRTRFIFDSVDGDLVSYKSPAGVPMKLTKDLSDLKMPWTLDDGSGILLRFDAPWGDLAEIVSLTGHSQFIFWKHLSPEPIQCGYCLDAKNGRSVGPLKGMTWEDPRGYVDYVINSSQSDPVYFVYKQANPPTNKFGFGEVFSTEEAPFRYLQCLSLTENDCSFPLVSFAPGKPLLVPGQVTVDSFDLEEVKDANGHKTTYLYEHAYDAVPDGNYRLSGNLAQSCSQLFADKQVDCRSLDLCSAERKISIHHTCAERDRWRDFGWVDYCISQTWDGETGDHFLKALDACRKSDPAAWISKCESDLTARAEKAYPLSQCRDEAVLTCMTNKGAVGKYAFGHLRDLRHNLLKIIDGDERTVVTNTYGIKPDQPDFDKVITHVQGNAPAGAANTMTMEYHDVEAARTHGGGSGYLNAFKQVDVCPESKQGNGGYDPAWEGNSYGAAQFPAYVVTAHDIGNVTRTTYFDASWKRLREIREDGGQIDYNYQNGYLAGIRDAAGRRVCYERDDRGRPLVVTELPSPKYQPADPVVSRMTYDDAGQLIETVRDWRGPNPAGVRLVRDPFERVLAVGRAVGPTAADWTCYRYSPYVPPQERQNGALAPEASEEIGALQVGKNGTPDPKGFWEALPLKVRSLWESLPFVDGPAPNQAGQNGFAGRLGPQGNGFGMAPVKGALEFVPSGCAQNLVPSTGRIGDTVDVVPSAVITPDGAVRTQSQIGPFGPQKIVFDAFGADPREIYFKYDSMGRLNESGRGSLNNPLKGSSIRTLFDAAGQLMFVNRQDPNNGSWVETKLLYDRSGNLIHEVGPEPQRDRVIDELGHLRKTDLKGGLQIRSTQFNHDIHGRLLDVTLPEGNVIHYDYDPAGRLWGVSRSVSKNKMETVESHVYDNAGLLQSSTDNGGTVTYVRDGFGRPTAILIPRVSLPPSKGQSLIVPLWSNAIVRGFDSRGRISWEAVYDGQPKSYAKPNAPDKTLVKMTEYAYDALDRTVFLRRWKFANGVWDVSKYAETKIAYDSSTNTMTTTDPEGKVTEVQTDPLGRPLHESQAVGTPDEVVTDYSYASGDIVTVSSNVPPVHRTIQYNAQGALTKASFGGRTVLSQDYDALGRLFKVQTQDLGAHSYFYNGFGQVAYETQETGAKTISTTSYCYDLNGRRTCIVDGANKQTSYFYDGLDRLENEVSGLGTTAYTYHQGTDRILQMTDPAGTTRTYGYFMDGLLQSEEITDGAIAKPGAVTKRFYDYTPLGRMKTATLAGGGANGKDMTVSMTYDSLGRKLTEQNDSLPVGVSHAYRLGEITTVLTSTDPNAQTTFAEETTAYDPLYRTVSVKLGKIRQQPFEAVAMRYQNGLLQTRTSGNLVTSAFSYNDRGSPTGVDVAAGNLSLAGLTDWLGGDDIPRARLRRFGAVSPKVDYFQVDLAGRLTTENLLQKSPQQPFNGDATNQAVDALMDQAASYRRYTLDGVANWLSRTGTDPLAPGAPDPANRYPTMDGKPLVYDKAGNLRGGGTLEEGYLFNGLGQLIQVTAGNTDKTDYTYDPLGRRITEDNGKIKNLFIWDGSDMVAYGPGEKDAKKMRLVVGGSGAHYALIDELGSGRAWYLHPGTDGSTLAVTDDRGNFAEGYSYSAFGETTVWDGGGHTLKASQPSIDNRFLFQGQWFNSKTYTMGAREYEPELGRWLEPDPIGTAGGLNRYAFVDGQPLSFADPRGLAPCPNDTGNQGPFYNALEKPYNALVSEFLDPRTSFAGKLWRGPLVAGGFTPTLANELATGFSNGAVSLIDSVDDLSSPNPDARHQAGANLLATAIASEILGGASPAGGGLRAGPGGAGKAKWNWSPEKAAASRAGKYETISVIPGAGSRNIKMFNGWERQQFRIVFKEGKFHQSDGIIPFYAPLRNGGREGIFVMDGEGNWYAMRPYEVEKSMGGGLYINHNSIMANGEVAAAGELVTSPDGKLLEIINLSGHYRPGYFEMYQAIKELDLNGITGFRTKLIPPLPGVR